MASDELRKKRAAKKALAAAGAEGGEVAWTPAQMQAEIRALQRKQLHHREKFLLLQQGMNQLAEALADHPGLDYPEELKPVSFIDGARDDVLFLAFGGVMMAAGMPPAEFLSSLTARDVPGYFIKDFRQSWYHEGLLGISTDIGGTADYLRSLVARHKPRRLVTLGTSAGGYAAIVFGCMLDADRVAAFSPQIEINAHVVKLYASFDTPPPDFLRHNDAAPTIEQILKTRERLPEISIYYGGDNRRDARNAARLAEVARVQLKPLEGVAAHSVTGELKRRGDLALILDQLIDFGGVTA